jgi:NAD(P)-dependent dehydrogenase (short-subunit alcohol dehydrogenase family)
MAAALEGKVALVTGGARGIGRGIAGEIVAAGGRAIVADLDGPSAETAARELGGNALAVELDVTRQESVDAAVATSIALAGRVDALVNNAGIHREQLDRLSTIDDFERCFDVNLYGIWRMSQALVPHFRRNGGGKIVNIASVNGRRPWAATPAYSASKAAAISLTQSLALTLGEHGITVNAVCPGSVVTGMADQFFPDPEAFLAEAIARRAIKRALTPEDIGRAVVFFASSGADLITGQSLNVNGGVELN